MITKLKRKDKLFDGSWGVILFKLVITFCGKFGRSSGQLLGTQILFNMGSTLEEGDELTG
jgi:hypothetical protein